MEIFWQIFPLFWFENFSLKLNTNDNLQAIILNVKLQFRKLPSAEATWPQDLGSEPLTDPAVEPPPLVEPAVEPPPVPSLLVLQFEPRLDRPEHNPYDNLEMLGIYCNILQNIW